MNEPVIYRTKVTINATPEKVWEALTNPEMTMQYMFGCKCETDWKVGSPVLWRGAADGVVYVSGKVVRFEPNAVLSYTVFDPSGPHEDLPENHLIGEYILALTDDGQTSLRVFQGDYSKVPDGERKFKEAPLGWEPTLQALKKVVEGL